MDPREIVETYLKDSDIALFKHPERDCVYEEAELIKQVKFDSLEFVQSQMVFYQSRQYPKNTMVCMNSHVEFKETLWRFRHLC